MQRVLLPVVAVVVVIAVGIVQGTWTDRWGVGEKVERAVRALDQVPAEVGDWVSEELEPVGREKLGLAGSVYRRYTNRKTGDTIAIGLVCGRPGPVAIHTPDVCYGASGFKVGKRIEYTLKGADMKGEEPPRFYSADMTKTKGVELHHQRLFWTWHADGRWMVDENPRKRFSNQPVLYKFYIARELTASVPVEQDPCVEFLRQLLPELQKVIPAG
jgi:hypothetical protein